jgi:hypothetical protein
LAEESVPAEETVETRGPVTFSLPYAPQSKAIDETDRPVPDVSGMNLREAVRALHRSGFRVRLVPQRGSTTLPPPGTPLAAGSVVQLQHIQ